MELDPIYNYPRNPLVIENVAWWAPQAFNDWVLNKTWLPNIREFNKKYPDAWEFIKSLWYDWVVAWEEIVKYGDPASARSIKYIWEEANKK